MSAIRSVAVAVTTYQRNDFLPELIQALQEQCDSVPVPAYVVIVDNNPGGDAAAVVAASPDVAYEHEPTPGIAAGRNRALQWAYDRGLDAIAFVDDDETPSPHWLASLLDTADQHAAAAVAGPVVREYASQPTTYVLGMRRWDQVRHQTGSDVPAASSANLLLDLAFLDRHDLRFDIEFGLSGGSDTLITRQIIQAGGRVVWSDQAVVIDHVTSERLTPQWLRKRGRRVGNTHSRVSLALTLTPRERRRARAKLATKGALLVVAGSTMSAIGGLTGNDELAGAGSWRRSRGHGILSGARGHVAYDYLRSKTTDPTSAAQPH